MEFRNAVPSILTLTGIFFLNFITRIILAPFLIYIREDFDLTKAQAGELFLVLSLGYSIGLLGSTLVSSRMEHHKVVMISALGIGGALCLAGLSPSGLWLRVSLLVAGLFGGLYFPSGFAMLTSMVSPAHWGKAIAIHEIAPNLSFVAAPLVAEVFIRTGLGWRWMLVSVAVYAVVVCILFVRYCGSGREKSQAPNPGAYQEIITRPSFWVLLLFFILAVGSTQGVFAQTPLYLVSTHDYDHGRVNYLLSISRISGIFLVFWAGVMVDRLGIRRSLFIFMGLTGLSTALLGVFSGGWLIVAILIQPTMACCYFPAGFAALSRVFSRKERPIAISLIVPTAVLAGGGLIPTILGYFGDRDMFGAGFVLLGGVITISAWAVGFLSDKENDAEAMRSG
ncbi:MFS transporter [Desulfonatronovibrio hydrogenovorans]|uniref:MFS transporter n=1 Tax=Desulfonatronovibrio hydrogenovorans TaxID=53245 RepID=UPI00068D9360|nr:MFS transporter [Desulfonatronovibrio hydrogenovorans]